MAIIKKNGEIYKLPGPNPIMLEQDFWEDFEVINFKAKEVITNELDTPIQSNYLEPVKILTKTINYLPSIIKEYEDPLYGEVRKTVEYNTKNKCESLIIKENDLSLTIWVQDNLNPESILYTDKRWWKVDKIENQENGFICECIISEIQPSFD